jgi:hypothetical protein
MCGYPGSLIADPPSRFIRRIPEMDSATALTCDVVVFGTGLIESITAAYVFVYPCVLFVPLDAFADCLSVLVCLFVRSAHSLKLASQSFK